MPTLRSVGAWLLRVLVCCITKPKVNGEEDEEEEWETFSLPGFEPKVVDFSSSISDEDCEWRGGGGGRGWDAGDAGRQQKARGRLRQRGFMYKTCSPCSPAFSLLQPRSPEVRQKRPKTVPWIRGREALKKGNAIKKRVRVFRMAPIPNPVGRKRIDSLLLQSLRNQCISLEERCLRSGLSSGALRARQQRIRKCLRSAAF